MNKPEHGELQIDTYVIWNTNGALKINISTTLLTEIK